MARVSHYSERETAIIRANPYTAVLREDGSIRFTVEFKKFAYNEYLHNTKTRQIFEKAGYGNIFSSNNMSKYMERIRKEAQSESGFKDPLKTKKLENVALEKMKYEKAIKELQDHVIYLEQELDFLKKIALLNNSQK